MYPETLQIRISQSSRSESIDLGRSVHYLLEFSERVNELTVAWEMTSCNIWVGPRKSAGCRELCRVIWNRKALGGERRRWWIWRIIWLTTKQGSENKKWQKEKGSELRRTRDFVNVWLEIWAYEIMNEVRVGAAMLNDLIYGFGELIR